MTSSTNSSTSLGELLASTRSARDQTPSIGVELRSIGGEVLDREAAMLSQKLLEGRSLVSGRIVQKNDDRAPQGAQQLGEKHANFFLPDIVEVELIVQAQAWSSGAYGDSGNDRDLVSPSLAMVM